MNAPKLLLLVIHILFATTLSAAEPVIANSNLRGLQIGGSTTLTLDGSDFGTKPTLLFSFPAQVSLQPMATEKRASFDIKLGNDVPPGFHHLRLVSEHGVSLPLLIGADRMPQLPWAPKVDALPVALHGSVTGSGVLETRFPGKAGQKVQVEVEALRLGTKVRPVLHLYNSRKLQLAWSWAMPQLTGDTRLEATLPEAGEYIVALHDAEYAAGAGLLRIKLGEWSYADHVFPPMVAKGSAAKLELVGASRTPITHTPSQLGIHPLAWPNSGIWSGTRPSIRVSPHRELIRATKDVMELSAPPVGVSARLETPFGEDQYRISVTPGSKIRIEVLAARLGSTLDAALVLRGEKGEQLSRTEDSPGTSDPSLEYTVPDKVNTLLIGVVDAQGRAGLNSFYRIACTPANQSATPQLQTPSQRLTLTQGGRTVMPIWIDRAGFEGPVHLTPQGLPPGMKVEGNTIPAGQDGTLVTISGNPTSAAVLQWSGLVDEARAVQVKGHPLERLQPWLAREVSLGTCSLTAADFSADWNKLPDPPVIYLSDKTILPVQVPRTKKDAAVRLTVVTSQNPPLVNNQPDPNRALRTEKPVDIAADALTGEVTMLVPPQLTGKSFDVCVQVDLLATDKKTVLATTFTPPRRFEVRSPIVVTLTSPTKSDIALDKKTGAMVKVQGKIERKTMLGEVTVAVAGLPAGAKADTPIVKAETTDFTLTITLPATTAPGELTGLKLIASAPVAPNQPNVRVNSDEIPLTLVVK